MTPARRPYYFAPRDADGVRRYVELFKDISMMPMLSVQKDVTRHVAMMR